MAVLLNGALPFYTQARLDGRRHPPRRWPEVLRHRALCEIYLELKGIEHRKTGVRMPRTDG